MLATSAARPTKRDILIVSTTPVIREVLHDVFLTAGYEWLLAADGLVILDDHHDMGEPRARLVRRARPMGCTGTTRRPRWRRLARPLTSLAPR
jgi:hypothetical protein